MRLIDSHAHLDDRAFARDRAAVIARAFAEGIGIIAIGADLRSSREAVRLARRHRRIWATVGAHPHGARNVDASTLEELERLASGGDVVAMGEMGLDFYRDLSPRDVQRTVFARQLELAARLELPVVLHNRESTDDLLATLRDVGCRHRGVVHSFLGGPALAREFLDLGLHVGIGGPVTFPRNVELREAVQHVPLERILIETDCPYLTPIPRRGTRNEPAHVVYVAREIAALKGISADEVGARTTENTARLFGLAV